MALKIGLDLDGVVYDWHSAAYRYCVEERGYKEDSTTFWTKDWWLLSDDEQRYIASLQNLYINTIPSSCVKDAIIELSKLGEIYYVTARAPELEHVTRKFLDFFDPPFKENLFFEKDKTTFARLHKLDYFLDDFTSHIKSLLDVTGAVLMARAHNIGKRDGYIVVNSIKEFCDLVKEENCGTSPVNTR